MEFKSILLKEEYGIAILSINRPEVLNAINTEVLKELNRAIYYISENDDIRVVIIKGEGRAFSSGGDIAEMQGYNSEQGRDFIKKGQDVFRRIEVLEKPIIAAINGCALGGGCELAMSCDIRIAEENAKFGHPELNLGIIPGFGGTQRLVRLVGRGKAKEMIYTGDIISAEEAAQIGLIERIVPQARLMEEAMKMAEKIASKGQVAVKYAKTVMTIGIETDIDTALEVERDAIGLCFATEDQKEGMSAFLEKRKAEFKGR